MKSKSICKKFIVCSTVAVICGIAVCAAGCSSSSSNAALDAEFDFAKAKVSEFSSSAAANTFKFSDSVYSKANIAAMLYNSEADSEALQQIARNIGAESIIVTDGKGIVKSAFPEDTVVKDIKENEELKPFIKAAKGISAKVMSDPEPVEDSDEYSLYAGVKRVDDAGAVIIGYKTEDYSMVTGSKLADECGPNVVVLSGENVISSTLKDIDSSKTVSDLGVKREDIDKGEFTLKTDADYSCKAEKLGDYTLICCVPN